MKARGTSPSSPVLLFGETGSNLAPRGPHEAVSLLCTGTAGTKERRKSPGATGVCAGSPHSCVLKVLAVSPSQPGARLGKELGGSGGWQKINHSAVTLCPNWFPQTKLHCPLTRTNKRSRERLKVTGDLKYLP